MADTVHSLMEQMVPELEDLERRGLFKKAEIKQIVKKRQDFEYLLKRRRSLKEDYLRYIDYETKLEALRQNRKQVLVKQLQADNARVRWRSSLSDHAITRRIMFIYERASRKFKGDLSLWLQYLEYCRSKSGSRQMQKVLTKALQLHPARPALWIYAAAWEFEANQNAFAARSLMQRGLRMCPKSEQLWLEYLRMELTYAQRLKARREVLGLATKNGKRGADDASGPAAKRKKTEGRSVEEESESEEEMEESESEEELEESESEEEMEERRPSGDAAGPVPGDLDQLSYRVAASTFQNAIASIPSSLELRTKFLAVLENFEFEGLEQLEDKVYASIARDFVESAEGRACLALRWVREQRRAQGRGAGLSAAEARGKAADSFREALELQGTPQMAEMYAHFLDQCMKELHAEGPQELEDGVEGEIRSAADAVGLLLEHLEACRKGDLASERMAERHVALLLQRSGRGPALETASRYCEAGFKGSARLWVLRLGLEMQERREGQGADRREERLDGLFERALRAVAVSEALPIWNLVAERLSIRQESSERLLTVVVSRLQSATGSEGEHLACALLEWAVLDRGLAAARKIYTRLLAFPGPGLALYKKCIQLETLAETNGAESGMERRRPLFEAALEVHSQAWDLWLEYCRQEMQEGHPQRAAAIQWRAKKALHNPAPFLDAYKDIV